MKKLALILSFFLATPAFAAITVDATANGGGPVVASSQSWNHTVSGSNTLLVVGCQGNLSSAGSNITGATFNGVSMNQVGTGFNGTSGTRYAYEFYLINPASGTHSVVVSGSASSFFDCASASYDGVKQTGQPDQTNTGVTAGSPGTATFSVTTTNSPWSIFGVAPRCNVGTGVTLTNVTLRSTGDTGTAPNNDAGIFDSNGTSASSVSFACAAGDTGLNAIMATFDPAVAAVTTIPILGLVRSFWLN